MREFRIRRRRSLIFRRYLNDVKLEFSLTGNAVKVMLVQSPCDRPDLASRLVRAQVDFLCGMMRMRFRLLRYQFGFG
jgi:hypothetical protein